MSYKKITTWEHAAKLVGVDPEALPDVSMLPERLQLFTTAMYKRAIVVEALNKALKPKAPRWIPDYNNSNEYKYYPWVGIGADPAAASGFGFSHTDYRYTGTGTGVGARLSLRSSDLVEHMFKHFRQVLIDTLVIPPDEK
jgi:hypothetical protein